MADDEKSASVPQTISDYDKRDSNAWFISFSATMIPFLGFCYGHHRGVTVKVLERMAKMRGGVYGFFALPFITLGMEKSIYDTVQSLQGINPRIRPKDRGGFPSGGAGKFRIIMYICVIKGRVEFAAK